jgi:hypothetical protein
VRAGQTWELRVEAQSGAALVARASDQPIPLWSRGGRRARSSAHRTTTTAPWCGVSSPARPQVSRARRALWRHGDDRQQPGADDATCACAAVADEGAADRVARGVRARISTPEPGDFLRLAD